MDMDTKMLVLDIDGTLTNSKKEITQKTKKAIFEIMENGHIVTIASGRPTKGIMRVCSELELEKRGGFALSYNGARISDMKKKEDLCFKTLDMDLIPKIYDFCLEHDIGMMTYQEETAITGTDIDEYMRLEARINNIGIKRVEDFAAYVDFPVNKCLLTAPPERAALFEQELVAKFGEKASIYRSEPFFIEIMPKGVDKASSLKMLLEMIGMEKENTIACGDGFNDLSMIKFAGVGVAMANAESVVKDAADFITRSNDEDGIVLAIEKFF